MSPQVWLDLCDREGWDIALAFDLLATFQNGLQASEGGDSEDADE